MQGSFAMTNNRLGEKGSVPFRSGRLFRVDNHWYFATREVAQVGPYLSKEQAEVAMAAFVASRIYHSAAFVKQPLCSGGPGFDAGQSQAFSAMVNEAVHFFAARAKGQRKAAHVLAGDRLKSLRAVVQHDHTAGPRVAVLEHVLEADASSEDTDSRLSYS